MNPFVTEQKDSAAIKKEKRKLNLYTGESTTKVFDAEEFKCLSVGEKTDLLFKLASNAFMNKTTSALKKITDPFLSKTTETTSLLMASTTSLSGDQTSEIYQLINLLSNKKPYVAIKAASILEQKIVNPDARKLVLNYFKFNPDAQVKFNHLYKKITELEA